VLLKHVFPNFEIAFIIITINIIIVLLPTSTESRAVNGCNLLRMFGGTPPLELRSFVKRLGETGYVRMRKLKLNLPE
jgi:hypothetical protein